MSVFLIGDIKVTDDSWVPDYAANVHNIVEKHGGKYLSRSGNISTLEGQDKDSTLIAIIQFPHGKPWIISSRTPSMHLLARQGRPVVSVIFMSLMTLILLARSHTFRLARKCLYADSQIIGNVKKGPLWRVFCIKTG